MADNMADKDAVADTAVGQAQQPTLTDVIVVIQALAVKHEAGLQAVRQDISVAMQALKADMEVKCAEVKNEVQGEIDQLKGDLQHSNDVARELVDTVMQLGDRLSAVEASSVQGSDAVKRLEDRVNAVELGGDSGQKARIDLWNIKTEPGQGDEDTGSEGDARSIETWLGGSAGGACGVVGQSAGLLKGTVPQCSILTPMPPHPRPASHPVFPPVPSPYTPPPSPPGHGSSAIRRKPQEFDGRVSLEAYMAHFELLAQAQRWDEQERAVQLVSSLKGPAMEVLSQLTPAQRTSYASVVAVLERRYGHHHQAEVFRARFRARVRARGETLQQLAQDLEHLVRKAYPGASEELTVVLLRDQFVDALEDAQLQIYVKQAHVSDLQEALARALEFESFVRTSAGRPRVFAERELRVRQGQAKDRPKRTNERQFRGACWKCQETGHKREECRRPAAPPRSRSAERVGQYAYQPCCWECGQLGHLSWACPGKAQSGKTVDAGNGSRLGKQGRHQPVPPRPFSR